MKLKITSALIVLFIVLGCAAVKDYIEPEERVLVTALVIENSNEQIKLSAEVNVPDKQGGNQIKVYSSYGKDIETALSELEKASYGKLLLGQCPVILLSKDLPKSKLKNIFYTLFQNNEISLSVKFAIFEEEQALLSEETKNPAGYEIENLLNNIERAENKTVGESFAQIIDKSQKKGETFTLPLIEKQNSRFALSGFCRFKNFSLIRKEDLL